MAFKDWQDTVGAEPLTLPIRDRAGVRREYAIPPLGYLDGIRLQENRRRVLDGALDGEGGAGAAPMGDEEWLGLVLGGALARMREDNVPPAAIVHAASVAYADEFAGRAVAEALWNDGPDPEALAAAIAEFAAAATTTSPDTGGAASSTRPPAATSGMRPPTTRRKPAGRKSSTSTPRS